MKHQFNNTVSLAQDRQPRSANSCVRAELVHAKPGTSRNWKVAVDAAAFVAMTPRAAHLLRRACVLVVLFLCSLRAFAAVVAGFTPGSFAVSPSGAATYSVPISVPHGIADLQPTISLDYSSHAKSGLLGVGWTLSGTSTITRCPKTKRQDGVNGGVTFTSADRFCLNGQRLVLDGATPAYGSANSVYRTEGESFARIKALNSTVTGQLYFTMETKAGLTYEFGNTTDSSIKPARSVSTDALPTIPLLWALNKVSDRFGNTMLYSYVGDATNGSYVIDRITYNGGKAYMKFVSAVQSGMPAVRVAGTKVTNNYYLTSIEAHVVDEAAVDAKIKTYNITYDTAALYGIPESRRLRQVQECGSSGVDCFGPITFDWSYVDDSLRRYSLQAPIGPVTGTENFYSTNGYPDEKTTPRFVVDVNGDGLADLVAFKGDGVHVLLNNDVTGWSQTSRPVLAAFGTAQGWTDQGEYPRQLADVDGDGNIDIVGFAADGVWVSKWDSVNQKFSTPYRATTGFGRNSGWKIEVTVTTPNNQTTYTYTDDKYVPRLLADMDGDGILDIVGIGPSGVVVAYGDGTNFAAAVSVSSDFVSVPRSGLVLNSVGPWVSQDTSPRQLADLNGDGYPDLIGLGYDGISIALWDPVLKKFGTKTLALSAFGRTAAASTPLGAWTDDNVGPRRIVDVNGDGYPDIVGFAASAIYVALWDGKKFLTPVSWGTALTGSPWTNEGINPRNLVDVNNDGLPDIVAFGTDGVHVLLNTGSSFVASSTGVTKWSTALGSGTVDVFGEQYNNEGIYPRKLADLDGDGLPDIVAFGKNGLFGASPFFTSAYSQFRVSSRAGVRITGVLDSLGGRTDIQYSLAAGAGSYYKRSVSPPPNRDVIGPLVLVTQVARSNGLPGGLIKQRYRYGGLKAHPIYGSLGFETMAVRDEQTGLDTLTTFSQTYPFTGQAIKVETARSTVSGETILGASCTDIGALCQKTFTISRSATPISRSTSTPSQYVMGTAGEYASNSRTFTFVSQTVDEAWELDGTQLPTKTTTIEYNEPALTGGKQWGNVTKMTVTLSDGHQTITTNTYEPANEATWLLGRMSTATVRDIRPARTISVAAPSDGAPPPSQAPLTPQVLMPILSLILED